MRYRQLLRALLLLVVTPGLAGAQVVDGGPQIAVAPIPPPPKDPEARRTWLKARIDEILAGPAVARAKVSVAVMDPESGKLLYARNEKIGLNAASNVKIEAALRPIFSFLA